MNILLSGSTGLIGSALVPALIAEGNVVTRLIRDRTRRFPERPAEGRLYWDPEGGRLDPNGVQHMDAVIHLAGENIAAGRWTPARKARIRDSRVKGTRLIAETLSRLPPPLKAKVLLCASAMGYYGDRGDEILRENSPPGSGFLAEVCQEWEAAAEPARQAGIRVAHLRFGMVLSGEGGALAKMLPPFRLGVGGRLGSGKQYMSWVALDDATSVILHALNTEALQGPVNVASPDPVTNSQFTKTLGRVLSRPTPFPMPAFAARLVFGEMAEELLLGSARLEPARLVESGYVFRHPELEEALRYLLKR